MKRIVLFAMVLAAPLLLLAAKGPTTPTGDDVQSAANGVTVHEWGTFTSVAGPSGEAVTWLPLGDTVPLGSGDLPCFVDHFNSWPPKYTLSTLVRMETPVLYFYSPKETRVNVGVAFPKGLITEWYPHATAIGPTQGDWRNDWRLEKGSIHWNNVIVVPDAAPDYPTGSGNSHYYAARKTDSSPLKVHSQKEKFLFYRGMGNIEVPIAAMVQSDGKIEVRNLGKTAIDGMILFQSRNGKLGYRVVQTLRGQAVLDPPSLTGSFEALRPELEAMLLRQGLFEKEARAMVETWRDSWFEDGTRVLYMVPGNAVNAALPLTIDPKPVKLARAFVGRLEIITPEMMQDVKAAAMNDDRKTLERYGLFLDPIATALLGKPMKAEDGEQVRDTVKQVRTAYFAKQRECSK